MKSDLEKMIDYLIGALKDGMSETGDEIVNKMKQNLSDNGSIQTGKLRDSIRQETKYEDDKIKTLIYADSKSDEGTQYAEFVEYGTGIYNEFGDGRKTAWRYKDKDGNWHTTHGQKPKPFIRPAVESSLAEIQETIRDSIQQEKQKFYKGVKRW